MIERGAPWLDFSQPIRNTSARMRVAASVLVDHVNYILMNQYRQELGLSGNPWDQPAPTVTDLMVKGRVRVHWTGPSS